MSDSDNLWALVLATGEGKRLRELTMTDAGLAIPLERDPRARLIVLPSDHHVREEERLAHGRPARSALKSRRPAAGRSARAEAARCRAARACGWSDR